MSETAEDQTTMTQAEADEAEGLRQAVRDYVNANSSSYKAVATVAGVAESTFTAWLSGKYKGRNGTVDEKIRIWLASEKNFSRKKSILPAPLKFVHTRTARKFLAALEHAQAMPDVSVIVGGAGIGKTSSCLQYKATHPNVWHLTAEPSMSSSYAMLEYLRETLSLPETAPYRVSRSIALKVMNSQGLIIIDEAQHLTTTAIDQLRTIHDRAGIGLALVGNEEVWKRIDGGGRKAELAMLFSRVGMRVTVTRSTIKDAEEMLDAEGVTDPKQRTMLRAVAAKPGALRQMTKVLRIARMLALGEGEELDPQHITLAWDRLSGGQEGAP